MIKLFIPRNARGLALAAGAILLTSFVQDFALAAASQGSLKWTVKALAVDGNEGIDIADFNKDGKLDVIAGRSWYAAPDFVARPVRTIEDWNGYVESNGDYAHDVNGDGWIDVIAGSFLPTEVHWYENPKAEGLRMGKMWPKHLLKDTGYSRNEGQLMHDLDGDGVPEWVVNSWGKDQPLVAWKLITETREVEQKKGNKTVKEMQEVPSLKKLVISSERNGHGLGFGDLNGDGLEDVLFQEGWYERPKGDPFAKEWKFHQQWLIHASVPVLVRDMNGDGRNDILAGMGHAFGLHWHEQLAPEADGKLNFKQHTIDDTFSQPHALHFADLDGDGEDELITGKRVYAHNGNDPGGKQQPCIYYYEWNRTAGKFSRHTIEEGSVGIGLQIRTADLNGDGRLDIAVAGKSGTHILFNNGR
jgi:hypothetical protein